jgi:hypothetical protein
LGKFVVLTTAPFEQKDNPSAISMYLKPDFVPFRPKDIPWPEDVRFICRLPQPIYSEEKESVA